MILLILFIFIILNYIYKKKETFMNNFCSWNHNDNKCNCVYQKDDVHINFPIDDTKCNYKCNNLNKEECNLPSDINYWCPIAGKCIKYSGKISENNISSNNCGYDILNNQLIMPYTSEEDCLHNMDYCNRYNDNKLSILERKDKCLKDMNCGLCLNKEGDFKCISGTASGPNDLNKYYYCEPTKKDNSNKYIYGNHTEYLLEK